MGEYAIRHQVQLRNRELADAVNDFFETRDVDALADFASLKSVGEQVMIVGYLLANDFGSCALELSENLDLDLQDLQQLDRENGHELALAMGWIS